MQEIATRFFAELERHRRRRMPELLRNAVRAEDSLRIAELELAVTLRSMGIARVTAEGWVVTRVF